MSAPARRDAGSGLSFARQLPTRSGPPHSGVITSALAKLLIFMAPLTEPKAQRVMKKREFPSSG